MTGRVEIDSHSSPNQANKKIHHCRFVFSPAYPVSKIPCQTGKPIVSAFQNVVQHPGRLKVGSGCKSSKRINETFHFFSESVFHTS